MLVSLRPDKSELFVTVALPPDHSGPYLFGFCVFCGPDFPFQSKTETNTSISLEVSLFYNILSFIYLNKAASAADKILNILVPV
jgi:hypothetical protein